MVSVTNARFFTLFGRKGFVEVTWEINDFVLHVLKLLRAALEETFLDAIFLYLRHQWVNLFSNQKLGHVHED